MYKMFINFKYKQLLRRNVNFHIYDTYITY